MVLLERNDAETVRAAFKDLAAVVFPDPEPGNRSHWFTEEFPTVIPPAPREAEMNFPPSQWNIFLGKIGSPTKTRTGGKFG